RRHAVVDAALLVQWKYDKRMDHVILVTSTAERRLRRMGKRGFDREEVRRRSRLQLSEAELKRHADMVMTNDGDLDGLRVKAEKLYRRLTGIS
ncbi:MAG: dephospho-CoA kinase, partial [candidate division Zixibacteria bacterium]|nr:dephospho-CoA kinase [candidate division Zixibacteria bacterium]